MLFASVTTDGVIPFHSVVWLCPIMPSRSVFSMPSAGAVRGVGVGGGEPLGTAEPHSAINLGRDEREAASRRRRCSLQAA